MIVYWLFLNVPCPPDVNQRTRPKNVHRAKNHYKQSGSNNSQSLLGFLLRRVSVWFVNQFQIRDPLLSSRCARSYLSMINESSAPGTYCGSVSFGCFFHTVKTNSKEIVANCDPEITRYPNPTPFKLKRDGLVD